MNISGAKRLDYILAKCEELKFLMPETSPDLASFSIQFALAHPELSTAIIGGRNAEQIRRNIRAAELPKLTAEQVNQMKRFGLGQTEQFNM